MTNPIVLLAKGIGLIGMLYSLAFGDVPRFAMSFITFVLMCMVVTEE